MNKFKIQNSKFKIRNPKFLILSCSFAFCILIFALTCSAQQSEDLEFSLDLSAKTISLPKIFPPNIDLSGRGFHRQGSWPQTVAAREVLDIWQRDVGLRGMYRLQYNLWEINELSRDPQQKSELLSNYETIIKNITDAGGVVILDLFGTPAGLGQVLDKKSLPRDLRVFKELIKNTVRDLSCNKRYNIWYEVWSAPDLDEFFLGRKQEYLNLYKAVAEAIKELRAETKLYIPVGGPSSSWWFQSLEGNTVLTPEKSLIYELIKFCYSRHLPLDFITWHGYSTDPKAEKANTRYKKKSGVDLMRDWLSYFNFDKNIPLIVDEWNYDRDANVLAERKEKSFIAASYIPGRIKNMYEAGIDYQLYFSLEDFEGNKEAVVRNTGVFSFDSESSEYKGSPKAVYNVFKMLSKLGSAMYATKLDDEFVGIMATKSGDGLVVLVYNYIDPQIALSYLSRNIAGLSGAEKKFILDTVRSGQLEKILNQQLDISGLRTTKRVKTLLRKAQELHDKAKKFASLKRNIKIALKNLKNDYLFLRYEVGPGCSLDCEFIPLEEKEVNVAAVYEETLTLEPYSVQMIILEKKSQQEESASNQAKEAKELAATKSAVTESQ